MLLICQSPCFRPNALLYKNGCFIQKMFRLFYLMFKLFALVELCGTFTVDTLNRFCALKIYEKGMFELSKREHL